METRLQSVPFRSPLGPLRMACKLLRVVCGALRSPSKLFRLPVGSFRTACRLLRMAFGALRLPSQPFRVPVGSFRFSKRCCDCCETDPFLSRVGSIGSEGRRDRTSGRSVCVLSRRAAPGIVAIGLEEVPPGLQGIPFATRVVGEGLELSRPTFGKTRSDFGKTRSAFGRT